MGAESDEYKDQSHTNIKEYKKYNISYISVYVIIYFHMAALYGAYLGYTNAKLMTLLYTLITGSLSAMAVVIGTHKLWSHRAFKATRGFEVFLMLCQSMSFQFTVYKWVIIHRQHHKYSDTASDPHDASRGLFYSHIGWMMVRRPGGTWDPQVVASADDIRKNPVLDFQRRHANWLLPTAAFILPTAIPLLWSEDLSTSWHLNMLRVVYVLNQACTINSIAHTWGYRPYDTRLQACTTGLLILLTFGEGNHNFHHAFPHDYRSCEKGLIWMNCFALAVDLFAKLGLVYDLKVAGEEAIRVRKEKRGDGSDFGGNVLCIF